MRKDSTDSKDRYYFTVNLDILERTKKFIEDNKDVFEELSKK
jgi:hypothetical protein